MPRVKAIEHPEGNPILEEVYAAIVRPWAPC